MVKFGQEMDGVVFECPHMLFIFAVWVEEKPVIDILDTTSFPIEKVEFPTVTLCPASSNSDRWGATIKLFDYLNVVCPDT